MKFQIKKCYTNKEIRTVGLRYHRENTFDRNFPSEHCVQKNSVDTHVNGTYATGTTRKGIIINVQDLGHNCVWGTILESKPKVFG